MSTPRQRQVQDDATTTDVVRAFYESFRTGDTST